MVVDGIASAEPPTAGRQPTGLPPSPVRVLPEVLERLRPVGPGSNCRCSSAVMPEAANSGVHPRTPHPAGDQGRHKQMIDPVAEPGQAAHASPPLFDATNGMEPDDARCVGACSNVLRDEHEIVD